MKTRGLLFVLALAAAASGHVQDGPPGRPDAVVDLATAEGVKLVKGQWRYSDTRIVEIDSKGPGPDLKPTGRPVKTYDYTPHAGGADFDDSQWEAVEATSLDRRRGNGRLSFNWYRIKIAIPERIGSFAAAGSTVALEIVVDDYAEIWVNGKLPAVLGQAGNHLVKGFNAPNRVLLARNVQPGQEFQVAIFGINGPVSDTPRNFIWIRSATLDFYREDRATVGREVTGRIRRLDAALDDIVPPAVKIEKLAEGFEFLEGPVWVHSSPESGPGYLLFSDPNANTIYRWTQDGAVSVYRTKSGYAGPDIGEYRQPGSNGLTVDPQGRLTVNEHGRRRVVRIEKNGVVTVLADNYRGKRLNSPNDLVYKSDGSLYFTDPPFGLPKFFDDPRKELPFSGIYRWAGGRVELLATDLTGPNGIAFSPDEKTLYVTNWDEKKKVIMRYDVQEDGSLAHGRVFFSMQDAPGEEALDGLKIDRNGNLYASGPGGLWIISQQGKHLGTIEAPELPANMAWGDDDAKTLYLAARTGLYRIRLGVPGIRP
ncbi:MAG: SMP-30/gluconolactonase/LRE family protein [Bryobacteraceae bacterium]